MTWKDPNKDPPPENQLLLLLLQFEDAEPFPSLSCIMDFRNGYRLLAWMPIPKNPKWIKKDG